MAVILFSERPRCAVSDLSLNARPRCAVLLNICMRYQIFQDDIGNHIVVDSFQDMIVFKVRAVKLATTVCQKLNKRHAKDKLVNRGH